jgi:hypothetical protein
MDTVTGGAGLSVRYECELPIYHAQALPER